MSALRAEREALKGVVDGAGGLTAYSSLPDDAAAPLIYVAPGDPYLSREGANYGCEIVTFSLVIVGSSGVNEAVIDELDEQLEAVIAVLDASDYVDGVGDVRAGQIPFGGHALPALIIPIATEINRAESTP